LKGDALDVVRLDFVNDAGGAWSIPVTAKSEITFAICFPGKVSTQNQHPKAEALDFPNKQSGGNQDSADQSIEARPVENIRVVLVRLLRINPRLDRPTENKQPFKRFGIWRLHDPSRLVGDYSSAVDQES
jgi:hypothetical protein